MGKVLACPRCQAKVDSGGFAPGSSFRCTDCGGLMRVPSGRTGVHPAVQAEAPGAPPQRGSTKLKVKAVGGQEPAGTGTKMRVKAVGSASETRMRVVGQARRQKSSTGLIVGLIAGVLVAVVALLVFLQPGRTPADPQAAAPRPPSPKPMAPKMPSPSPEPAAAPPADAPPSPPAMRADDPSKANWEQLMQALRPGGGFEDLSRPEGVAFAKVKRMGKPAYPFLIRYIDNEDVTLGRAAVVVLGELTGNRTPLPNESTKGKIKADWETWVKANP
jgi:hypothetical protein